MSRGLFAGATNYGHQGLADICKDVGEWAQTLPKAADVLQKTSETLQKSGYWERIPGNFISLITVAIRFYEMAGKEMQEIALDLPKEVRRDHVDRLHRISEQAERLDRSFSEVWNSEGWAKEYGTDDFRLVERLYQEGRDMVIDLKDVDNVYHRLADFVGRKQMSTSRATGRSHEAPGARTAVFLFGTAFVVTLIVLALFVPQPTPFQYLVFRVVLALAAAGIAGLVPGFIDVAVRNWVRAGGAMAVFAIVYFFSPARLLVEPEVLPRGANTHGGGSIGSTSGQTRFPSDALPVDASQWQKVLYFASDSKCAIRRWMQNGEMQYSRAANDGVAFKSLAEPAFTVLAEVLTGAPLLSGSYKAVWGKAPRGLAGELQIMETAAADKFTKMEVRQLLIAVQTCVDSFRLALPIYKEVSADPSQYPVNRRPELARAVRNIKAGVENLLPAIDTFARLGRSGPRDVVVVPECE